MTDQQVTDLTIARLWRGLDVIDGALHDLNAAPLFKKAEHAEAAITSTRKLLAEMVNTLHIIKNDLDRLKGAKSE